MENNEPRVEETKTDEPEVAPKRSREPKVEKEYYGVEAAERMRRISRRGFLWAGAASIGTYSLFHWIHQQPDKDLLGEPFRKALDFNESVMRAIYSPSRLSPTFKDGDITHPARTNGDLGLGDDFDPSDWDLEVSGLEGGKGLTLELDDIKSLPSAEFVTELKCIEGWSIFVKWKGALFQAFHDKYRPAGRPDYVALETPDGGYYVSIDMPSALHPQTLLCYEMNGHALSLEHGAPLRLVIPHKYGIKNIKRIGSIRYVTARPKDYWAEQGYDYYAGL